jgi:hypothetical protein
VEVKRFCGFEVLRRCDGVATEGTEFRGREILRIIGAIFQVKIFPQGGSHEGLLDFVVEQDAHEFVLGEQVDGDVLCGFKVLGVYFYNAFCHETVGEVIRCRRVTADDG